MHGSGCLLNDLCCHLGGILAVHVRSRGIADGRADTDLMALIAIMPES